jgi:hypothetical protein
MKQTGVVLCFAAFLSMAFAGHAQTWKQIGPAPIDGSRYSVLPNATLSGLINDIAIDPSGSTDSTIYIATGGGGIWKTTDGGAKWSTTTDTLPVLTMGAVALDPSNPSIVYAGAGGPWCCSAGGALYQSKNGGRTWQTLKASGVFANGIGINRIVLPASGTLVVATTSGLFKSIDGGQSFGNNSPSFNNGLPIPIATPQGSVTNAAISDLKLDTATPTTVYVAVENEGLFQSTDSGTTFPANGTLISSASFPASIQDVWITFAQSTRPDNKTIYAFLCPGINSPNACAVQKSITRGAPFTNISPIGSVVSVNQQKYDQITGVDPQDANKIYIGVRQVYYSADGGQTGFGITNEITRAAPSHTQQLSHTDYHAIAFSPASHFAGSPTRVYFGNDGGLASTAAQGSTPGSQWQFLNKGLATALMYDLDIGRGSKANNAYTYGALQDNGTSVAQGESWSWQCCGDSNGVAVDPVNPLHAITSNDGCLNTTTNGHDWSGCTGGFPANTRPLGLLRFDPNGGSAYATAATELFQSTNNGSMFSLIHIFPQNITAFAMVKGDKNTIWVGLTDGTVQKTHNALGGLSSSWSAITVGGAPAGQFVSGIAIDPSITQTVVVVYPGFSFPADPPQHVYMTINDGGVWENISGTADGGDNNLPDLPLYAVAIIGSTAPHSIVVGSDAGVLQTADLGSSWQVLGTGFPNVQVTALALDAGVNPPLLRASTWGRGVFQLEGSCPLCPAPPICHGSTACTGIVSISCDGPGVGLVFNDCYFNTTAPPGSCVAGFTSSTTVTAGGTAAWQASTTTPNLVEACTTTAAGQTCTQIALPVPTSCPPPSCPAGESLCARATPPACLPAWECLALPVCAAAINCRCLPPVDRNCLASNPRLLTAPNPLPSR